MLEVNNMDGILLQSVEGLGHSPFVDEPGETWERLQAEKEEVSQNLLAEGTLCTRGLACLLESEAAEEYTLVSRWARRRNLEARLRELSDAQDRLIADNYGHCTECADRIEIECLQIDPAASRCLWCQRTAEREHSPDDLLATAIH